MSGFTKEPIKTETHVYQEIQEIKEILVRILDILEKK